jgi:ABC-type hemin transport system ATPase subunit
VVVQETPSDFEFSVAEVVYMGRTTHKGMLSPDTQADEQIVVAALKRINMLLFTERQFNTLSGGEKQRVLVARALAQQPKFIDNHKERSIKLLITKNFAQFFYLHGNMWRAHYAVQCSLLFKQL